MSDLILKKQIKEAILNLLKEETVPPPKEKETKDEKPKKDDSSKKKKSKAGEIKIASGAVGRGSFKKFVREAGARADAEPKELLKDLGIESAPTGRSEIEKIQQLTEECL